MTNFATLTGIGVLLAFSWMNHPHDFVAPESPLIETDAPSDKVTNGTRFESGVLELEEGLKLVLPESAVVEEYDGNSVQFSLTRTLRFSGHPPHPMPIAKTGDRFGIAFQKDAGKCVVSTFGEWNNREGSAAIQLFVLVPRGLKFDTKVGLTGRESAAGSRMDFSDKALEECYWYSGLGPAEEWTTIETRLHYNRFLKP